MFTGVSASQAINIVAAIDLYPIRPGERAAIYRALALVPGVVAAGRARSLSGLNGVVLGARDPDGAVEDQLILDPRTGAVLGGRTVILSAGSAGLPAGTVRSQTAIVQRAITDKPRPPRAQVIDPSGRAVKP